MGWSRDGAYEHEGWVANVLADGRLSGSSTAGGVIVHELTADDVAAEREVRRYEGSAHLEVVVPWDQVAFWRVTCACGWTGVEVPASGPAGGSRDCPEQIQEQALQPDWAAHVAPYTALSDLERLVDQLSDIESHIADTAGLARAGGASWSQIGRAAGLSKQGAQQRWGQT